MIKKIQIHTQSTGWMDAEIEDYLNPSTARKIIEALPFESTARL